MGHARLPTSTHVRSPPRHRAADTAPAAAPPQSPPARRALTALATTPTLAAAPRRAASASPAVSLIPPSLPLPGLATDPFALLSACHRLLLCCALIPSHSDFRMAAGSAFTYTGYSYEEIVSDCKYCNPAANPKDWTIAEGYIEDPGMPQELVGRYSKTPVDHSCNITSPSAPPTPPPPPSPPSPASPPPIPSGPSSTDSSINDGLIAGIVVASIVAVIATIFAIIAITRKVRGQPIFSPLFGDGHPVKPAEHPL